MKMKVDRLLIITTLICLLPMVLSLILYDQLPEQIPTHWDIKGNPDDYSPKAFAAFGLPLLMAGLNLITHLAINSDPKKANSSNVLKLMGKLTIPFMSLFIIPFSLFVALGHDIPIHKIVPSFIGVLFIIIGNYLPKCKQNYTVGIKLPWTLNNEENWNRTHHLAGYLWVIGGILMLSNNILNLNWIPIFIILLVIIIIIPFIYSYSLFKKGM